MSAILVVIAIAFMLPALLNRESIKDATREQNISIAREQLTELESRLEKNDIDQNTYNVSKEELEKSLFNDLQQSDSTLKINKKTSWSIDVWVILLLVPLIAIPSYLKLGNLNFTKQFDSKEAAQKVVQANVPLKPDGTPDIEKITERLKLEMESNPTDPQGWYMLGRSYMLIERFDEAVESFEKSVSLRPDLADSMLALADALSMTNTGLLSGRPRELVKKALLIEPENVTALWLSGMAASQEGEYPEAIQQWSKVLPFVENRPDDRRAVIGLIEEAKSRIVPEKKKQLTENASQNKIKEIKAESEKKDISITVKITLSDELKEKASQNDSVFVYAKAMNGPPMPLAAAKKQVKDFPLEVILNDEMAMLPNLKLSSFERVVVGARISKTGKPIPDDGDLFTEKSEIKLGESVNLEIDQVYKKP